MICFKNKAKYSQKQNVIVLTFVSLLTVLCCLLLSDRLRVCACFSVTSEGVSAAGDTRPGPSCLCRRLQMSGSLNVRRAQEPQGGPGGAVQAGPPVDPPPRAAPCPLPVCVRVWRVPWSRSRQRRNRTPGGRVMFTPQAKAGGGRGVWVAPPA